VLLQAEIESINMPKERSSDDSSANFIYQPVDVRISRSTVTVVRPVVGVESCSSQHSDIGDDISSKQSDAGSMLEEYIGAERLRELSGCNDLNEVKSLEIQVDTSECTLGRIGDHCPNLELLKLNHSRICSIRDLGTSLDMLRICYLSQCGLEDLEGIGSMEQLRELYLSFNGVSDLSPIISLEYLECLDLEGNSLEDIYQIQFLGSMQTLATLTLDGNPLPDEYPAFVWKELPQLQVLDDTTRPECDPKPTSPTVTSPVDARAVMDSLRRGVSLSVDEGDMDGSLTTVSVQSAPVRLPSGPNSSQSVGGSVGGSHVGWEHSQGASSQHAARQRPLSARAPLPVASGSGVSHHHAGQQPPFQQRPASSFRRSRPLSGTVRGSDGIISSGQGQLSFSSAAAASSLTTPADTASSLTFGDGRVLCGNPTAALRARRRQVLPPSSGMAGTAQGGVEESTQSYPSPPLVTSSSSSSASSSSSSSNASNSNSNSNSNSEHEHETTMKTATAARNVTIPVVPTAPKHAPPPQHDVVGSSRMRGLRALREQPQLYS
jgi:hypothetical protein